MKRIAILITITLTTFLSSAAQTIDENNTRAFFDKNDLVVKLAFPEPVTERTSVQIELLRSSNSVFVSSPELPVQEGRNEMTVRIPQGTVREATDLIWMRLRVSLNTRNEKKRVIISLSEVMPDLFKLQAVSASRVSAGMSYVVHVSAIHPVSGLPVSNVELNGKFDMDEYSETDKEIVSAVGVTDSTGLGTLIFQVPENIKFEDYDEAEIEITGTREGIKSEVSEDIDTLRTKQNVLISTDKPLYQPGQTIFVRGLATAMAAQSRFGNPISSEELEFRIKNEDQTVLYRETVETSRFGIASIKWQIPENAKLGQFIIEAEFTDSEDIATAQFKVSRYELPNFIVNPKPDRDYYLSKHKIAKVSVDATYLFGKPVVKGKVKVVRESGRTWDYENQEWDIDEEEVYEGETNASGFYEAKLDLNKGHKELEEEEDRFSDLKYTAYFTDSTTNITEERRFDIRLSREDIHVYLIGLEDGDRNDRLPLRFFVSTSKADGTPVSAKVQVTARYVDYKRLAVKTTVVTNRFGAASVELKLPTCPDGSCYEEIQVTANAKDNKNNKGKRTAEFYVDDDTDALYVRPSKTIHNPGEPIELEILSSADNKDVFVDIITGGSTISSHSLRLKNGRGDLSVPYSKQFEGRLTIGVSANLDDEELATATGVIFPKQQTLKIDASTDKDTYRPATNVSLKYSVGGPDGSNSENALGIYVLDRAVEERAITDANFGGGYDPFSHFRSALGYETGFGGISENDLNQLEPGKPIDPDIELAASVMYAELYYFSEFFEDYVISAGSEFSDVIKEQMRLISLPLDYRYWRDFGHPTDKASFDKILKENEIDFSLLRDPWGMPYLVSFSIEGAYNTVKIESLGPNKKKDEEGDSLKNDDFTALKLQYKYFTKTGQAINSAVKDYHLKTGKYVRDKKTLKRVLKAGGIDLAELKDRWGNPYKVIFGANKRSYTIAFHSEGESKDLNYDNFNIWTTKTDYFAQTGKRIQTILDSHVENGGAFPTNESEFKQVLRDSGLDFDSLRDGWNRPYVLESKINQFYTDRVEVESVSKLGGTKEESYLITPVSRTTSVISILSLGEDGKAAKYSWQKIYLASFAGLVSEKAKDETIPPAVVPKKSLSNGTAAIYGKVTDQTGAVIPGATVTAINASTDAQKSTTTNELGSYLISNIPAGTYRLEVEAPNFRKQTVQGLRVRANNVLRVTTTLDVGSVTAMVDVTSNVENTVNSSSSQIITNYWRRTVTTLPRDTNFGYLLEIAPGIIAEQGDIQIDGASGAQNTFVIDGQKVVDFRTGTLNSNNGLPKKETPRVRNYFPETLLWAPEVVTDENGNATIKFTLADSITTWKIYAVASNLEGRIGISEKEIKTFQPFFVDLLPPKVLTNGDEISLPVQVRNYTDKKQEVKVNLRGEEWFEVFDPKASPEVSRTLAAPDSTSLNVATNVAGRAAATTFRNAEFKRGGLFSPSAKVSVEAGSTSNAIFNYRAIKPVNEGIMNVTAVAEEESDAIEKPVTVRPDGKEVIFNQTSVFREAAQFDVDIPANAIPNSHSAELKIYPNLLAHVAESVNGLLQRPYGCGEQTISSTYPNLMILKFTKPGTKINNQANNYLQKGYQRLLGYQVPGGGFSYWGASDKPNISLTAYALRFLHDAGQFIDVDERVVNRAKEWLVAKQRTNGTWTSFYHSENTEDFRRTWKISTYVVRSLAMTSGDDDSNEFKTALETGLLKLSEQNNKIDEAYSMANLGLAYIESGQTEKAIAVVAQLRKLAIREDGSLYWNLETNTPFFGWGTAGRIETTALVLQLLHKTNRPADEDIISGATAFLLKNKDRYGVWYSTQATINVLDALLASLKSKDSDKDNETASVFVNGKKIKEIALPKAGDPGYPISVDISSPLASGLNKVEVRSQSARTLQTQVVSGHYIDWDEYVPGRQINGARELALNYDCDKYEAKPTEEISCKVKAERIGFRGYGMLLAEIGTPPGADVDRASLDKAVKVDRSISRYDVLPDRIVVYMWSRAGGTEFDFKFKPRYGINAKTPASFVYDYYNEEAKALVKPKRFVIGR